MKKTIAIILLSGCFSHANVAIDVVHSVDAGAECKVEFQASNLHSARCVLSDGTRAYVSAGEGFAWSIIPLSQPKAPAAQAQPRVNAPPPASSEKPAAPPSPGIAPVPKDIK